MKGNTLFLTILIVCALAMPAQRGAAQTDTTFTYQGRLDQNSQPVNGPFNLAFALFDAPEGGTQIDVELTFNNVLIIDGLFTVDLDFGANAFDESNRWLRIKVNNTTLSPRQPVSRTPFAIQTRGLFVDEAGSFGIGTTTPANAMHLRASIPILNLQDSDSTGAQHAGYVRLADSANVERGVMGFGSQVDTDLTIRNLYADSRILLGAGGGTNMILTANGNIGVGTTSPTARLHVSGGPMMAENLGDQADLFWLASERSWVFRQQNTGAGTALKLQSVGGGGNKNFLIDTTGSVGIGTLTPQAKLDVNGTARVSVLEITGADLAEKFPASEVLRPGMVVSIDPKNAGQLCLSRSAYDHCVAGVVSGANDFSVGAVLGNLPGHEDAPAIALSGRVYVQCDTTGGSIEPGDLLTSSDVPGHAMKASDRDRSHGAVIGKAMESLPNGNQGLVLVLINLQ